MFTANSEPENNLDITEEILKSLTLLAEVYEVETTLEEFFPSVEYILNEELPHYGKNFVKRLKQYGYTEKGDKLLLNNWHLEYAEFLGDLRIPHGITAGVAQIGKSLFNMLMLVDFLIKTRLNALWFYPSKQQVDNLVPEVFGRIVDYYRLAIEEDIFKRTGKKVSLIKPKDRQLASRFQINNATAIFSYASTSGRTTAGNAGLTVVGASASSITASILFIDERSQIPPEAIAVLPRRLDNSRLKRRIIREVGTFGSGLGIELAVNEADHHFYPHINCGSCGEEIALNPKGCLLKPDADGNYLSETKRPKNWFYSDEQDKVKSAYFACSNCGAPITDEQRKNAYFKCLHTGVNLREYLDNLPTEDAEIYANRDMVAVHLSPLLRITKFNLAADLIKTGLETESVRDFMQQVLGFSSENAADKVTQDMVVHANAKLRPSREPDFILAGVDQGRQEDYVTITAYWLDLHNNPSTIQAIENSEREILLCEPVLRRHIEREFSKYRVQMAFGDNEPDRQGMYQLSQKLNIIPVDQRAYIPQLIKPVTVGTGGIDIDCLAVDNQYFQDMALNGFILNRVKTNGWEIHDRSIHNPVRHFLSVYKDNMNRWVRAKDNIDDLWFSYVFCEACFYHTVKVNLDIANNAPRARLYER